MATIEDVAKLAGLSRTTVSRVINNHPYVSEAKKQLVIEAMKQLGYVPNSSARSLRNQKTEMIAVIIPRVMNPFFGQLVESLEIAASEYHYQLIVCQTLYSAKKELDYLNLLKTKQVDGVILTTLLNDWKQIEPFLDYGPIVLCNEYDQKANIPMVHIDQEYGGYVATTHLIDQGHMRIAYCCGNIKSNVTKAREKGFRKAHSEHGLQIDPKLVFQNVFTFEDGKKVLQKLAALDNRPTAIFTGSDEVAAGVISEAKKLGIDVPTQLAVVGYDNQAITELLDPMITTVHQPVKEMAHKAMNVMMNQIKYKNYKTKEVYQLPLSLIIRNSTCLKSPERLN
ncbi:LacI family DNA-binding transcriptional regulator [Aeribacillus alveayuensis]|uniref:DNA-binding LacI/PurR family transcriptional regulator n=1 Tax=Aeribacillus alveayuensis TaxID=279215 RepID=A0ABT9VMZ4_9BACI|nr:DNA-binding LacI/PurR family transcriptional regulator [Bacillus alveayuensis]